MGSEGGTAAGPGPWDSLHGEGSGSRGVGWAWWPSAAVHGLWLAAQSPPSVTASLPHGSRWPSGLLLGGPGLHLLAEVPSGVFVPASSSSSAGTRGTAIAGRDGTGRPCPPGAYSRGPRACAPGPGKPSSGGVLTGVLPCRPHQHQEEGGVAVHAAVRAERHRLRRGGLLRGGQRPGGVGVRQQARHP